MSLSASSIKSAESTGSAFTLFIRQFIWAALGMVALVFFWRFDYRKLRGLYDMSVVVTSLNRPTQGVRGRMDAYGVSFDNGLKLATSYIDAFKWEAVP